MEPNSSHPMHLHATTQLFLPVRQLRVDRTEGEKHAASVATTLVGETGIHGREVLMYETIEAASPRLRDTLSPQHRDECSGVIATQTPQRPAGEVDVDVDERLSGSRSACCEGRSSKAAKLREASSRQHSLEKCASPN